MDISPVILQAVEVLRKTFGGVDVQIIDTEMNRKYPDNFAKLGYLGVLISVDIADVKKHEVFFRYQLAEDIIMTRNFSIAEDFIHEVIKDDVPLMLLKIKQQDRKQKLNQINEFNNSEHLSCNKEN